LCSDFTELPILFSHRIVETLAKKGLPMWLGGGEVDVKWHVKVEEFIQAFKPLVGDITYEQ